MVPQNLQIPRVGMGLKCLAASCLVGLALYGICQFTAPLVAPAILALVVAAWAIGIIWDDRGQLPVFDAGAVCITVSTLYAVLPPILYGLAGGQFSPSSVKVIYENPPREETVIYVGWMSFAYISALAAAYVAVTYGAPRPRRAPPGPLAAILLPLLAVAGIVVATLVAYGADPMDLLAQAKPPGISLLVLQVIGHLEDVVLTLKLFLAFVLVQRRMWTVLALWAVGEAALVVLFTNTRTPLAIVLLGSAIAWHHSVRPFRLAEAAAVAAVGLGGLLAYGYIRNYSAVGLVTANEFQVIWSNALLLAGRAGELSVPWNVLQSEWTRPIPQQLLPFPKSDYSIWFLREILQVEDPSVGRAFGALAQSVVNGGILGAIVRGAVVGGLLGVLHRLYVRNSSSFLATMAYLWLCVWSYYTFRQTTFYLVTTALYHLCVAIALVMLARYLLALRSAPAIHRVDEPQGMEPG